MKKIILAFIVLIGISTSCTKNFEDFNTDTKHPTEVPGEFLFANAQKALADQVASTNVNLNIWKLFSQYWTETTYTDEANYDIVNRTIADNTFRVYYRNVLADLKEANMVISEQVTDGTDAAIAKENKLHIITLLEVYCYNRMVDMFGNIPYSEALDIDNISPVYDDASGIYDDLLTKVTNALAGMNAAGESFGANDLYFAGDVSMWIKFGNTLKVKMGITLADVDAGKAQSAVESAFAGAFQMDELCELVYLGGSNSNPLYQDLVQSGRDDFVPANTIVDLMNDLQDPRRPAYFTLYNDSAYVGGDYGYSNTFSQYSHIAPEIQAPDYPITLMDYTELAFYLAEAAQRGWAVGGSAADYYAHAIESSFNHWGVDGAADYIAANPYDADNWKQSIGTQAYIAYYIRGFVGYTSWRRLDFPAMNAAPSPPPSAGGNVPMRFTYPINEQTLNASNYTAAASAIGGDELKTKLFWDKN
jgi:hypothetical protein